MSALQVVIVYAICTAITLYLCISTLMRQKSNPSGQSFILLCGSLGWWLVCNALFYIIQDEAVALFVHEMKFMGVAFTSVFLFHFTTKFLHLRRRQSGNLLIVLCIIPVITTLMAATNPAHSLFRAAIDVVYSPYRGLYIQNGPWYLLHTGYSYGLILFSAILVLLNVRKTPLIYRAPQYVVMVGIALSLGVNAAIIFTPNRPRLDITPVSMTGTMMFLYWAMSNSRMTDYLNMARDEIYNTMATGIFIMDLDRLVVDVNRTAMNWCQAIGIKAPIGQRFDAMIQEALARAEGEFIEGRWDDDRDILLTVGDRRSIFSLTEKVLSDRNGLKVGSYISINDDTQARMLIDRLEYSAGVDPLTNLSNRRVYEKRLMEMDVPENMPLSIIMSDVNNLKTVNDRYGHEEGDKLLCAIADILRGAAPRDALIARIGGDEFVIVMANTNEARAGAIIEEIRHVASAHKGTRTTPNIALGNATKYRSGEDLPSLVEAADKAMYADKRNDRRRRGDPREVR